MLPQTMASGSKAIHGRPLRAALIAAPTQIRVAIEEMTISDVLQGAVYFFMAVFFRERAMPSNETQAQPRLRGTQSGSSWKHTSYAGHPRERRCLSRWLQRLVRRFHLCSGEKHVDSDRALPTGVCLLSISRPPGERS